MDSTKLFLHCICLLVCMNVFLHSDVFGQDKYLVGDEGNNLQMIVHIVGEVKKPGEYRVLDGTTVLDLFSKAGGPTEFSKLGNVVISRIQHGVATNGSNGNGRLQAGNEIIKVNIDRFLKKPNSTPPPTLKPGDVVLVPRNAWSKWQSGFRVVRDISVVVSLYLLYVRATNN